MKDEVLVVDDEPQMLIAVQETLRCCGYSVTTAGSGVEALNLLKQKYFHLVITDMRMPEVSGLELLHKVKQFAPRNSCRASDRVRHGSERSRGHARRRLRFPAETLLFRVSGIGGAPRARFRTAEAGKELSYDRYTGSSACPTIDLACQAAQSSATVLIEAEKRDRKRAARPDDPFEQPPEFKTVCRRKLRSTSRESARERAVRVRERDHSPGRAWRSRANSSWRIMGLCCWTRSAKWRLFCKPSCCAYCRRRK